MDEMPELGPSVGAQALCLWQATVVEEPGGLDLGKTKISIVMQVPDGLLVRIMKVVFEIVPKKETSDAKRCSCGLELLLRVTEYLN